MKKIIEDEIEKKLQYIGLDLNNVPETLKIFEPLNFRITKKYEENKYKQYRFVPIKDIEILLTPTNRLNSIEEKYSKASPIYSYLVPDTEENILKHATFLKMLKKVRIEDIEEIEAEQKQLTTKIPFKVKYPGNYLWQIYYSENTDKYFMLVPTEDSDYSTFFFLLKKQLEKKRAGKIFVPISCLDYSRGLFTKTEIEDIENYLWLFTKDWPSIYEVHDKTDKISIQIVGEMQVYENIKTPYKIVLNNKMDANMFYKLIKALFILQTELPHYYNYEVNVSTSGEIEFYFEDKKIEYSVLAEFINQEYKKLIEKEANINKEEKQLKEKLQNLQIEATLLEADYLAKEKQISTFLECKKSFLGKVKYFIKYSKKSKKKENIIASNEEEPEQNEVDEEVAEVVKEEKVSNQYTLEELINRYKKYAEIETNTKNTLMDINAIKLKNKNIMKKIENAKKFIEEIDSHKKSIFEFWRYTNKDEVAALEEGEQETLNVIPQIKRKFDYEVDLEAFGQEMDKLQRKELTKDELDSIYISSTDVLDVINTLITQKEQPKKEIENSLKKLKEEALRDKSLEAEEVDIFGSLIEDGRKVKTIANKNHREIPKDKYTILNIQKTTKSTEYKFCLDDIIKNLREALKKTTTSQEITLYKAIPDEINLDKFNIFDFNPEKEIKEAISGDTTKINLYKINLSKGTNVIAYTNSVFYDNQNKTLPIGMDLSTKALIDSSKITDLTNKPVKKFKIVTFEDEKNELSKIKVKTVNVFEANI